MSANNWLEQVRFGPDGLVPVIAQDATSGAVLMLAWANRDALERTRASGRAHYFSRSRQALWQKGETSGHVQAVHEVRLDCDGDAVLYRVDQTGPACHEGTPSCFSRALVPAEEAAGAVPAFVSSDLPPAHLLDRLAALVAERAVTRPEGSYTARLLEKGIGKAAQKVGEEATEVVVAATSEEAERVVSETADLLFHLVVLLQARGVRLDDVWRELERRGR